MSTTKREMKLNEIRSLLKSEADLAPDPQSVKSAQTPAIHSANQLDLNTDKHKGSPFEPFYTEISPKRSSSDNMINQGRPFGQYLNSYINGRAKQNLLHTDQFIMSLLTFGNQFQMSQGQPPNVSSENIHSMSNLKRTNTPPQIIENSLQNFQQMSQEPASQSQTEDKSQSKKKYQQPNKTLGKQNSIQSDLLGNVISDEQAMAIYKRLNVTGANTGDRRVKRNWHHSETQLLYWVIKTYSKSQKIDSKDLSMIDWEKVSQFVPGRNANQCQYKWQSNHKPKNTKAPWTAEEDARLKKIIEEKGPKSWADISRLLNVEQVGPARQGKQCRERWFNHVNPEIKWQSKKGENRDSWTEWEDITLLKKQQSMGNKWSEIAKCIPGRTENSVKNRFNSLAKKERTKLQEQNKATNNTRAENAVDLKNSMATFFKGKSCTSSNDIWIEPLIKQLLEQFENKHNEEYDINKPPEVEMQWNHIEVFQKESEDNSLSVSQDCLSVTQSRKREIVKQAKNRKEAANSIKIEITPPKQDPNFLMAPAPNYHRTKPTNGATKRRGRLDSGTGNMIMPDGFHSACNSLDGREYTVAGDVLIRSAPGSRQHSPLATLEEMNFQEQQNFRKKSESIQQDDFKFLLSIDHDIDKEQGERSKKILSEVGGSDEAKEEQKQAINEDASQDIQMKDVLQRMNLQNSPYFNEENPFPHTNSGLLSNTPNISFTDLYLFENPTKIIKKACEGKPTVEDQKRENLLANGVKFNHQGNLNFTIILTEEGVYMEDGEKMFKLAELDQEGLTHTLSFGSKYPKTNIVHDRREIDRFKDYSPHSQVDSIAAVKNPTHLASRRFSTFMDQSNQNRLISIPDQHSVIEPSEAGYAPTKRSNSNTFLSMGYTPTHSDFQINEPITPPPSLAQMIKQLNKNKQSEHDASSNMGDLFPKQPNNEEKTDIKLNAEPVSPFGNLGISADDFLATLGGQSLQEYTQAQQRNEPRRQDLRLENPSNYTAPSISEDNRSQASTNFLAAMHRDQIRMGGGRNSVPTILQATDSSSLNPNSLAQLNRAPPSFGQGSIVNQPTLTKRESTQPPSFRLGGVGSIFSVPGQSKSQKIAQVMKHQGPASYGSNPDEIPHSSGPQSVGGISLQFLSQPNYHKPGPMSIGYNNQNNRALSDVNGPFQPFQSAPTPSRPHYDYDCTSVLSKDQND